MSAKPWASAVGPRTPPNAIWTQSDQIASWAAHDALGRGLHLFRHHAQALVGASRSRARDMSGEDGSARGDRHARRQPRPRRRRKTRRGRVIAGSASDTPAFSARKGTSDQWTEPGSRIMAAQAGCRAFPTRARFTSPCDSTRVRPLRPGGGPAARPSATAEPELSGSVTWESRARTGAPRWCSPPLLRAGWRCCSRSASSPTPCCRATSTSSPSSTSGPRRWHGVSRARRPSVRCRC